ncbi:MAG: hypothetical protein D4R50_02620 [Actinomycetales bacterium]|nr:MAG: hypothetical protein D4R50_02620 [Actinomycetales bacterium]
MGLLFFHSYDFLPYHIRRPGLWEKSDGRTDDSHLTSAQTGAKVLSDMTGVIANFIVQFHHSAQ